MNISEFLLARIAEDEAVARNATWGSWSAEGVWTDVGNREWQIGVPDQDDSAGRPLIARMYGPNAQADVRHIARGDPVRVLAECEAKRRIVELAVYADSPVTFDSGYACGVEDALVLLALPYADHPDYQQEWAVQ